MHIVFAEFNKCQDRNKLTQSAGMEEAQNVSSFENEAKGMDVHLGVKGSNFDGHGEEIYKEGNMMKIIERLQKHA